MTRRTAGYVTEATADIRALQTSDLPAATTQAALDARRALVQAITTARSSTQAWQELHNILKYGAEFTKPKKAPTKSTKGKK